MSTKIKLNRVLQGGDLEQVILGDGILQLLLRGVQIVDVRLMVLGMMVFQEGGADDRLELPVLVLERR